MRKLGACIALYEMIPKTQSQAAITSIISNIRSSGARAVLVFAVEQDVARLFDEAVRYDTNVCQRIKKNIYKQLCAK